MKFTINSKKLGKEIEFSIPGKSYIFVDLNGKPGTLGEQICKGGSTMGSTISYHGDDMKEFSTICKRWWKLYLQKLEA